MPERNSEAEVVGSLEQRWQLEGWGRGMLEGQRSWRRAQRLGVCDIRIAGVCPN